MGDPGRADATRTELDRLGAQYFLDVRATARRILENLPLAPRTAFAAAVAERILREDEHLPDREHRPYLPTWRPLVDSVWQGLAGDGAARRRVATALARFYLSPEYHDRRHDDPADGDDHAVMASLYAGECYLHGCLDFATWAGWRGFDAATIRAAGDATWPHRRPAGIGGYAWELAHPAVQAELEQQLVDLELLAMDGGALEGRAPEREPVLERLRHSQAGYLAER